MRNETRVEPPRLSRRLQNLRGWSHEQIIEVFPGSSRTSSTAGVGAAVRAWIAMGSDEFDREQNGMYPGNLEKLGASGRTRCGETERPDDYRPREPEGP